MQVAGTQSWRMACDEPRLLLLALYVRDAAGLEAAADPPVGRLEPVVSAAGGAAPEAAAAQWAAWWSHLVASEERVRRAVQDAGGGMPSVRILAEHHQGFAPPGFDALRGRPELRDLVARHFMDAQAWRDERSREMMRHSTDPNRVQVEWEVLKETEWLLGRTARPFRLQVSILPVSGGHCWRVAEEHLLVTRARYLDVEAWRSDLAAVVAELA
jgi:hypothetical protein